MNEEQEKAISEIMEGLINAPGMPSKLKADYIEVRFNIINESIPVGFELSQHEYDRINQDEVYRKCFAIAFYSSIGELKDCPFCPEEGFYVEPACCNQP
jgi:hypothetical protein